MFNIALCSVENQDQGEEFLRNAGRAGFELACEGVDFGDGGGDWFETVCLVLREGRFRSVGVEVNPQDAL